MADEAAGGIAAGGKAVGRLVDCSQAEDRRMIRAVRARPLLYARNNLPVASYFAKVKQLWQEVADEMGWTVAEVRRKWSHVRNSYSRHLRNEAAGARTGRGRQVSRWYLADELDFLRAHMATDIRWSPYSCYAPSLLNMKLEVSEEEAWPAFPAPPAPPAPSPPLPPAAAVLARPASLDGSFAADENCSFFQFFRGIYQEYEELSPQLQRGFKRRCLDALHELLDLQDRCGGRGEADVEGEGERGNSDDEPLESKVLVLQEPLVQEILP